MKRAVFFGAMLASIGAFAQISPIAPKRIAPVPFSPLPSPSSSASSARSDLGATNLRAQFGTDLVMWDLIRSSNVDDRLRGLERLRSIGSPEAISMLVRSAEAKNVSDARELVSLARALADFSDQEKVRLALLSIMSAENPRDRNSFAGAKGERVTELARSIAALALAKSRSQRSYELLFSQLKDGSLGARAAREAFLAYPPPSLGFLAETRALEGSAVNLLGALSDLRTVSLFRPLLSSDASDVRANAARALGGLGDERSLPTLHNLASDAHPLVRVEAATAIVRLAAPDRVSVVAKLFEDERTVMQAIALSPKAFDDHLIELLHARAVVNIAQPVRLAAIDALGKIDSERAVRALFELAQDPTIAFESVFALSRNPHPNALSSLSLLMNAPATSALAIHGYVARSLRTDEHQPEAERTLAALSKSANPRERALAALARVALGREPFESFAIDREPRVRHGAAMGLLSLTGSARASGFRALARTVTSDGDATLRTLLANGIAAGDVSLSSATEHALGGGPDAPIYARIVGEKAPRENDTRIDRLLASETTAIRVQTVRGIGRRSDAYVFTGRLHEAYRFETDPRVRREIVRVLLAMSDSPTRQQTLSWASSLDPDPGVRAIARGVIRSPSGHADESIWLRISSNEGARGSAPLGYLFQSNGDVIAIAFDDDGLATIGHCPAGDAEVVLAPSLTKYESVAP